MTIHTVRPSDLGGRFVADGAFDPSGTSVPYREANQTYSNGAPISGFEAARPSQVVSVNRPQSEIPTPS